MFFMRAQSEITGEFGAFVDPQTASPIQMIFCSTCGSTIAARPGSYPEVQIVLSAALDDTARFAPRFHMWVSEKLPWIDIVGDLPRFQGHPDWEMLGGAPDLGAASVGATSPGG